jgi:hypothetical protein
MLRHDRGRLWVVPVTVNELRLRFALDSTASEAAKKGNSTRSRASEVRNPANFAALNYLIYKRFRNRTFLATFRGPEKTGSREHPEAAETSTAVQSRRGRCTQLLGF